MDGNDHNKFLNNRKAINNDKMVMEIERDGINKKITDDDNSK